MRILLTADPMLPVPPPKYGGIERIVDALVRVFRHAGHEVALVAHVDSRSPADRHFAWRGGPSATFSHLRTLRQATRSFAPDVAHSFSRLAYLLPLLPTRLPKVMSYQRHTGGAQIRWANRLGGRSLVFTGCSEFISAMGRRAGGDWRTIHNFVELDRFPFAPSVPADAPLVFLSRIEAIKGPDLAIAVARAAGRRLILAGNRVEDAAGRTFWSEQIAPHLGNSGVEWIGEVDDTQKSDLLRRAAGLLVPIRWDEPFGIVFAEALACGTPILTCARGALPEIVTPGKTGFFFETAAEGVTAVQRLGKLDRALCRRTAEDRFGAALAARRYLDLYGEVVARNS